MPDKISFDEWFPSIPNVAESFKIKHHGETHSDKVWEELFKEHLEGEGWGGEGTDD